MGLRIGPYSRGLGEGKSFLLLLDRTKVESTWFAFNSINGAGDSLLFVVGDTLYRREGNPNGDNFISVWGII